MRGRERGRERERERGRKRREKEERRVGEEGEGTEAAIKYGT